MDLLVGVHGNPIITTEGEKGTCQCPSGSVKHVTSLFHWVREGNVAILFMKIIPRILIVSRL